MTAHFCSDALPTRCSLNGVMRPKRIPHGRPSRPIGRARRPALTPGSGIPPGKSDTLKLSIDNIRPSSNMSYLLWQADERIARMTLPRAELTSPWRPRLMGCRLGKLRASLLLAVALVAQVPSHSRQGPGGSWGDRLCPRRGRPPHRSHRQGRQRGPIQVRQGRERDLHRPLRTHPAHSSKKAAGSALSQRAPQRTKRGKG